MKINKKTLVSVLVACSSILLVSCDRDTEKRPSESSIVRQFKDEWLVALQPKFKVTSGGFLYDVVSVERTDGRYDDYTKLYLADVTYKLKIHASSQNICQGMNADIESIHTSTPVPDWKFNNNKELLNICNAKASYAIPKFERDDIVTFKRLGRFRKFDNGWRLLLLEPEHDLINY